MSTSRAIQQLILGWATETFGPVGADPMERARRFLEEALELVQVVGLDDAEAHRLVDYVFARPKGEAHQETGGCGVTLFLLAEVLDLDLIEETKREHDRVTAPGMREKMQAKHELKRQQGIAA